MAKSTNPLPGRAKKREPMMEKTKPRMKHMIKPWIRVDQLNEVASPIYYTKE